MKTWHWTALALLTIASIIVEFNMHPAHHWWSKIPLFWIAFGLVGCAAIVFFAKAILARFIYKSEDYYHE